MNRVPHSLSRCRPRLRVASSITRTSLPSISNQYQPVIRTFDSILDHSLHQQVQQTISHVTRALHNSPLDRRKLPDRAAFNESIKPTINTIVDQALDQAFASYKPEHQSSFVAINQSLKTRTSIGSSRSVDRTRRSFSSLRSFQQLISQSISSFSSTSDGSRGPSMALPFAPLKPATDEDVNDPLKAFSQQRSDPIIDSTKQPELALNFPALTDLPPADTQPVHVTPPSASETPHGVNPEQAIIHQPITPADQSHVHPTSSATSHDSIPTPQPTVTQSSNIDAVSGTSAAPAAVHDHHSINKSTQPATEQPVDLGPAATDSHSNINPTPAESAGQSTATAVPAFLRPAELSMLDRIRLHPLFQLWPNIGYIISACATLVSDILWLRSLLICANFFGVSDYCSFRVHRFVARCAHG